MSLNRKYRYCIGGPAICFVALLVFPTADSFATSNRSTVRQYLKAIYRYERTMLEKVTVGKTRYRMLASQIGDECPGIIGVGVARRLRGSRRWFKQIGDLREELRGILGDAFLASDRRAALMLAAKLRLLHWNASRLQRRVTYYAQTLANRFRVSSPELCNDIKAWAASGFRRLSAATNAFLHEYEPRKRLRIRGEAPPPEPRRASLPGVRYELERYDLPMLMRCRLIRHMVSASLDGLKGVAEDLEHKLGFPALTR